MIDAIAASRKAREAERERQWTDPNYFSRTGGVRLHFFFATWPLATLSGDNESLQLRCQGRMFLFPRSRIQNLSRYRYGLFSTGLRIEDTEESFPKLIVFLDRSFTKLKSESTRLGYDVRG